MTMKQHLLSTPAAAECSRLESSFNYLTGAARPAVCHTTHSQISQKSMRSFPQDRDFSVCPSSFLLSNLPFSTPPSLSSSPPPLSSPFLPSPVFLPHLNSQRVILLFTNSWLKIFLRLFVFIFVSCVFGLRMRQLLFSVGR